MVGATRTRVADIDAQITSLRFQRRIMVSHIAWVKKQAAQAARPASAPEDKHKPRPRWPSVKPARPGQLQAMPVFAVADFAAVAAAGTLLGTARNIETTAHSR